MLNFDFGSKRAKKLIRFGTYGLSTLFVVGFTIVLVFATLGYDIDSGQVIQNGLVLVNSEPSGSTVTIDGNPERDDTPGRFSLPEGVHTIRVNRDGYQQWTKTVSVQGSEVVWLYYPLLIPSEVAPKAVTTSKNMEFITAVPDGQRFMVREKSNNPRFRLITLSRSSVTNEETITLNEDLFTLKNSKLGTLKFAGWAKGDDYFMVRHIQGKTEEFILVNVNDPEESFNLSSTFDLPLEDVRFIDDSEANLYALVDNNLRRLNLNNQTISAPIVENVNRYVLHGERFVVYLRDGSDGSAEVGLIEGDSEPRTIEFLPRQTADYRIQFAEYDDVFHLAILDRAGGSMSILFDPHTSSDDDKITIRLKDARFLSFSRNGRFAMAQAGTKYALYDFDEERRYTFTTEVNVDPDVGTKWLDGHRLSMIDLDGVAHISEFDGMNTSKLGEVNPKTEMFYDSGQKFIYWVGPKSKSGVQIINGLDLIVEDN